MTDEEPAVQPQSGRKDAKANAKAAKAYSKAQRPWYKKKRWIISLGLILLIVAVSAGSSGGGDSENASDGASSSSSDSGESSGSGDDGKSGRVGEALENAGTTYEVTNAKATKVIGDPELGGARADGTFVVVDLQLTNNKDETKTFTDTNAKIESSDGNKYETSDKRSWPSRIEAFC